MKLHPEVTRILQEATFKNSADKKFMKLLIGELINKLTNSEQRINVLQEGIRAKFSKEDIKAAVGETKMLDEIRKITGMSTTEFRTDENKLNWIKNLVGDN